MGGERASSTRQRLAGTKCALCGTYLGPAPRRGERVCPAGCRNRPGHTRNIYVRFERVIATDGKIVWRVNYNDGVICLPRVSTFTETDGPMLLLKLAERGQATLDLAFRQALAYGIAIGRGGFNLRLTGDQIEALRRPIPEGERNIRGHANAHPKQDH